MRLTLILYQLYLPASHSLKDKRSVIKGLKERIRNKLNVSVAEVDYQDKWQRSTIAVACVSSDSSIVDKTKIIIENMIEDCGEVQLLRVEQQDY
ncbi:DUF503 domain-containing protein [bacterium]|nr:DUF503 domain-containing protein [bacterium]